MGNEHRIGRYLDPMVDFAFKHIFGEPRNKHLMITLLENVYGDKIEDITFRNVEHLGIT